MEDVVVNKYINNQINKNNNNHLPISLEKKLILTKSVVNFRSSTILEIIKTENRIMLHFSYSLYTQNTKKKISAKNRYQFQQ